MSRRGKEAESRKQTLKEGSMSTLAKRGAVRQCSARSVCVRKMNMAARGSKTTEAAMPQEWVRRNRLVNFARRGIMFRVIGSSRPRVVCTSIMAVHSSRPVK